MFSELDSTREANKDEGASEAGACLCFGATTTANDDKEITFETARLPGVYAAYARGLFLPRFFRGLPRGRVPTIQTRWRGAVVDDAHVAVPRGSVTSFLRCRAARPEPVVGSPHRSPRTGISARSPWGAASRCCTRTRGSGRCISSC